MLIHCIISSELKPFVVGLKQTYFTQEVVIEVGSEVSISYTDRRAGTDYVQKLMEICGKTFQ